MCVRINAVETGLALQDLTQIVSHNISLIIRREVHKAYGLSLNTEVPILTL